MHAETLRRVGELGEWLGGATPSKSIRAYWEPGNVPWVTPKDMSGGSIRTSQELLSELGASRLTVFAPGDVAVVFRSGILRHSLPVASAIVPFTVNQDLKVLRPADDVVSRFAFHALRGVGPRVVASAVKTGTTVESIDPSQFFALPVFVPPPQEQHQIATILDTLDDAIRSTEQIIAKLQQVKQGFLHDLLTRGIDDNGELRDPERHPEQFRETRLGLIPRDWDTARFGEVARDTLLGTSKRGADGEDVALLKMGNLTWGGLDLSELEMVARRRLPDLPRLVLVPGDLLFNTRNTPALVGKTAAWRGGPELIVTDNNILRVRFGEGVNGVFLAAFMGSGAGRRHVGRLATGTTSVAAIYWKGLSRLLVPLPPRQEQDEIVARIDALDDRAGQEACVVAKLRQVRRGVAEDLLTGRVRVTTASEEIHK